MTAIHEPTPGSRYETERQSDVAEVFAVYGESLHTETVIYPDPELGRDGIYNEVFDKVAAMKLENAYVALVDGAFDVPHDCHEWYLRHCKLLATKSMLTQAGIEPSVENIQQALTEDKVRLLVTVDADAKVAAKKGSKAEKGGIARPVYVWQSRAQRVAGYHYTDTKGINHKVVDLVTVEGDPGHVDTPLESSLHLAEALQTVDLLDAMIVYGEHDATVAEAYALGLNPIVISDETSYAIDPRTGKPFRSSTIIKQIRGDEL